MDKTKTKAGIRDVPINDKLFEILKYYQNVWGEDKRNRDYSLDGVTNFCFLAIRSKHIFTSNSILSVLVHVTRDDKKIMIDLPHITPHILRHTACTRWIDAGLDLKTIQYMMGHSDIDTIMKIYNHISKHRISANISKLNDYYVMFDENLKESSADTNLTPNL